MPLLETERLSVRIGSVQVCRLLNLQVNPGECWCILGRNGTGKTTLLHTLAGLRNPGSGGLMLHGKSLAALRRREVARHIGVLLQDQRDSFPASVMETVLIGRHPFLGAWQWETANDHAIARAALRAVDLEGLETRNVATLSGGERRRLGIATLLVQDPDVFLLDEPANHLDIYQQIRILDLLRAKAREEAKALLVVLHDINLAVRYCNRFLLLFGDGDTAQGDAGEVLTKQTLERLYVHPLHSLPGPHGPVWVPE
ncbi:MAG: ABC transporter ATP-binding protein [Gammaproteobacteria bacterium]|jgi:iron complex transport system ATP-binding protein